MAEPDTAQHFRRDLETVTAPHAADICAESVRGAYTAAIRRAHNERSAYEAAVRSYLLYHPDVPQQEARLAVARIIATRE